MNREILIIVRDILQAGKCAVSKESSDEYVAAAAFVFDEGLFFFRDEALKIVEAELAEPSNAL
ncbi:hypothetical protein [Mesorhizobium sp. M4B.F.Ca.ET.058.02.1.1]|uniref:hypothetical protein n=1 Tax=Mesorhizobium sp. M4B.F.Ca.ET.058.02.1.1 TaxID=2493675 RepID=UPI000F75AB43|nr:hypothetical protein [Mesorhizobium sp. M4B.F.Ca.ET.058.02.1.1]AZO48088.1 hypothetical protein EJ073_09855 [Mesorhizobium sp. M4B.F.Ca.ET.058.02.1.1]TIU70596.1 MAG: hypothetical protein E5W25_06675 [Mesorhizobium sp.]